MRDTLYTQNYKGETTRYCFNVPIIASINIMTETFQVCDKETGELVFYGSLSDVKYVWLQDSTMEENNDEKDISDVINNNIMLFNSEPCAICSNKETTKNS